MRWFASSSSSAGRQRRHHLEPLIADLAELATQLADPAFQIAREFQQPVFLAILAGHPVLAAVDGDVEVAHGFSPPHRART